VEIFGRGSGAEVGTDISPGLLVLHRVDMATA
jgi:hypothetical protein